MANFNANENASSGKGNIASISDSYYNLYDDDRVNIEEVSELPGDLLDEEENEGISVADAYQNLTDSERKSAFTKMASSESSLSNLILTGLDSEEA